MLNNSSARPRETWYYPKAINDVDKIIDALIAIQKLDGKKWTKSTRENIGTQTELQQILKDEGIYGGTPSDMAGRNWMATFQFFGWAYVDQDKKIKITPAGKDLATTKDRNKEVTEQLLKLQFPNPYQSKSMNKNIQMAPFWTTLKLIEKTEYLTQEEHAYFLMWIKNESEIDETSKQIIEFRKTRKRRKLSEQTETLLRDIAGRIRLYHIYTGLLLADESRNHIITFNLRKITEIKKILNKTPTIDKKFLGKNRWNEWFEHYGARTQPRRTITGVLTGISFRARKLESFLNNSYAKNKLKIKINKIEEETHIQLKDIKKILNSNKFKAEFPILEQITISGNDIIISAEPQKVKNDRTNTSKFSKRVAGFKDIIDDATRSDDYDKFEQDVGEIFQAMQFNILQLGTTKVGTAVTDVIIKSEQSKNPGDYWACLIDAKSRVHGFEIETGSRRAMKEYFEKYQKTVSGSNPFPAKLLMFVSSKFNGDVENKLNEMKNESKVDCCCISAENLLYLLDRYLSVPITHERLLSMFKANKEITRSIIDNL